MGTPPPPSYTDRVLDEFWPVPSQPTTVISRDTLKSLVQAAYWAGRDAAMVRVAKAEEAIWHPIQQ